MVPHNKKKCLISACLTGLCTRYDGRSKPSPACLRQLAAMDWIPVCPEQLGGLPTPRTAAELIGGNGFDVLAGKARVINRDGIDVTKQFLMGADQVLTIAQSQNIRLAFLRAKSPSCGLTPQHGVTAALLQQHDIKIIEF
ncbi:MAG: DUF523 domain-containing protein [Desulfobulbaceae bacterium]|nr:DUF523 domain-containing protein [Desulfobulbaceae bacterium]